MFKMVKINQNIEIIGFFDKNIFNPTNNVTIKYRNQNVVIQLQKTCSNLLHIKPKKECNHSFPQLTLSLSFLSPTNQPLSFYFYVYNIYINKTHQKPNILFLHSITPFIRKKLFFKKSSIGKKKA